MTLLYFNLMHNFTCMEETYQSVLSGNLKVIVTNFQIKYLILLDIMVMEIYL